MGPAVIVPVVAGVGILGTLGVLRLRAVKKGLTPKETAEIDRKTAAAGIPVLPRTPPDQPKTAAELAQQNEAARLRAAALTSEQMAAVDANAIVGKTVAAFDAVNGTGSKPFPLGTFKAGDIFPTDRVGINVKVAGLNIPGNPSGALVAAEFGDILIRATKFNTDTTVQGVIIDPRVSDPNEHPFPLAAVIGVGPVDF
jgi:hypothetical protein